MERQCSRANLPPAVVALLGLIAFAITVYLYRHIILETLIALAEAAGLILLIMGVVALTINAVRWNRRRSKAAIANATGIPVEAQPPGELIPGADKDQMERDAKWLANPGTELAWSPDGKSLRAKEDG